MDAAGNLTPGDASSLAARWNVRTCFGSMSPAGVGPCGICIASESVTPVGFGRFATEAGVFQNLLRSDAIGVVRPALARHGITQSPHRSRHEPYYVAAAPFHDGGRSPPRLR